MTDCGSVSNFQFASINWPLLVFFMSGQFLFELSFCFSVCISVHCRSALVVLDRCLSVFPALLCSSFEQTWKLTFKPRWSLALPTSLPLKGMNCFCACRKTVLEKLLAHANSFIVH